MKTVDKNFGFIFMNWFRLTDLVISTLFFALIAVISVLYKELSDRFEDFPNIETEGFSIKLDEWKGHYDTVCQIADNVNHIFGLVLLVQFGQIVVEMTIRSAAIMMRIKVGYHSFYTMEEDDGLQNHFTNIFMAYNHVFLRLLAISMVSWILENEV